MVLGLFPNLLFPSGLLLYFSLPAGVLPVFFFKQGNQPSQIKPSQTKIEHNLALF